MLKKYSFMGVSTLLWYYHYCIIIFHPNPVLGLIAFYLTRLLLSLLITTISISILCIPGFPSKLPHYSCYTSMTFFLLLLILFIVTSVTVAYLFLTCLAFALKFDAADAFPSFRNLMSFMY